MRNVSKTLSNTPRCLQSSKYQPLFSDILLGIIPQIISVEHNTDFESFIDQVIKYKKCNMEAWIAGKKKTLNSE